MLRIIPAIFLLAAVVFDLGAGESVSFPAGTGEVEVEAGGNKLKVFTYLPEGRTNSPLLVVFHGLNRNAQTYRDNAKVLGDRFGLRIAAPEFDARRFSTEMYQRGGIITKGNVQPEPEWTVNCVAALISALQGAGDATPVYLIGHSAGGQFLTRLTAFAATNLAVRIVAANPGSHIFPTRDLPFQYGFGKLPAHLSNDTMLQRYLARPLTLYLGTADTLPENLDQTTTAMQQGATRIERGRNCFSLAKKLAEEKGWVFNWRLVEAPGIGHSSKGMFEHAACQQALFDDKRSVGK